jgi:hypothetical protein
MGNHPAIERELYGNKRHLEVSWNFRVMGTRFVELFSADRIIIVWLRLPRQEGKIYPLTLHLQFNH